MVLAEAQYSRLVSALTSLEAAMLKFNTIELYIDCIQLDPLTACLAMA